MEGILAGVIEAIILWLRIKDVVGRNERMIQGYKEQEV